jgi:hypothetical protein
VREIVRHLQGHVFNGPDIDYVIIWVVEEELDRE